MADTTQCDVSGPVTNMVEAAVAILENPYSAPYHLQTQFE